MTTISPDQMTRELRLKLALAKLLCDEIEVTDLANFKWRCGENAGEILRDTEWDYVLSSVMEKHGDYHRPPWETTAMNFLRKRGIEF